MIVLAVISIIWYRRRAAPKEGYGDPPGRWRALTEEELGDRGWARWDPVYQANTASAISHLVERSA